MLIINPSMSYGPTFKLFDIYPGPGSNTERDRTNHPLHTHAARPPQAKETNLWSLVLWLFLHSVLWPHWEWFTGQRCHLSWLQNWGHSSYWFTGHPFNVEVNLVLYLFTSLRGTTKLFTSLRSTTKLFTSLEGNTKLQNFKSHYPKVHGEHLLIIPQNKHTHTIIGP